MNLYIKINYKEIIINYTMYAFGQCISCNCYNGVGIFYSQNLRNGLETDPMLLMY